MQRLIMSNATEVFISSFHSINDVTIGKRRKSLFDLLKQTQLNHHHIIFSYLQPRTPLEEVFKLESLIYFRRIPELLEVLQSENPILIKKLLKKRWFIKEAFENLSPEELLLIFSKISFNVKVKILNRLSICLKNCDKADSFFTAIRNQYGLYMALKLLPACNKSLILIFFKKNCKQILPKQVLTVINRYPTIVGSVLEALASEDLNRVRKVYKAVFMRLGQTQHSLFISLYQQYKLCFSLGKRSTHKLILQNKQLIIEGANNLHNVLHTTQTIRSLGEYFKNYYIKLFPKSVEEFPSHCKFLFSLCTKIQNNKKLQLMEECFRVSYNSEIWDNKECVTPDMLNLASKETLKKIYFKPIHLSEDQWCCYLNTSESVPVFKKKIALSSDVTSRIKYLCCLVVTCAINKDLAALLEVTKYVVTHHRNDHISVRNRFLEALNYNFKIEDLEEEHWTYIDELIEIFEMNHEPFSLRNIFLLKRIHYLLCKELPVQDCIVQHITTTTQWNVFIENPEYEKQCLLLIGDLLADTFEKRMLKYKYLDFLNSLINWNIRHSKETISIFCYQNAIDNLKNVLRNGDNIHGVQNIITYCLKLKENDEELTNLCILRWKDYSWNIAFSLMRDKLELVFQNVHNITSLSLNKPMKSLWRYWRNYTHMDFVQEAIEFCLKTLDDPHSHSYSKRNAIICLSHVMPPTTFLELTMKYYPTTLKVNSNLLENRVFYHYQRSFGSSLKNIIPCSLTLESIVSFCQGDFLKLVLVSLYSAVSNVNEDKLQGFFDKLFTKAVSVRKHVIHLTLRALDQKAISTMFTKFVGTEKNCSIRKFMLKGSLNLFFQNSEEFMWNLVKVNVEAVDLEDKEVIDILMQIDKIPFAHKASYVILLWTFLEKSRYSDEYRERKMLELLRVLPSEVVQSLPKEFSHKTILKYFKLFTENPNIKLYSYGIYVFTSKYIIYCNNEKEQEERMKFLIGHLKIVWNYSTVVDDFLKVFCMTFLLRRCIVKAVLSKFISLWIDNFELHLAFDQILFLQFSLLCVEKMTDHLTMFTVGKRITEFASSITEKYGDCAIPIFCDVLDFFHKYLIHADSEDTRYELVESIVQNSQSDACLIIAMSFLKCGTNKERHNQFLQRFSEMPNPIVRIYKNHYLCKKRFS
ncbi:hypothetical protein FQA39_LY17373 [Lamprigera yunnana]|nr:hypothetical protein FQA39_LY17373 [Lamprigera yunnana]